MHDAPQIEDEGVIAGDDLADAAEQAKAHAESDSAAVPTAAATLG